MMTTMGFSDSNVRSFLPLDANLMRHPSGVPSDARRW